MGIYQDTQAEIARLQEKLTLMQSFPEDTFSFGTILIFASNNKKEYYVKTGENKWRPMKGSNPDRELNHWILSYFDIANNYFEIYVMQPDEDPIYSSPVI